jgi:hypothetical protein
MTAGRSLQLKDTNGTLYLAEPAGVWAVPAPKDGIHNQYLSTYFEGEEHPDEAVPLYRLTVQEPAS